MYVHRCFASMYACVPGACRGQMRALDLELELVSCELSCRCWGLSLSPLEQPSLRVLSFSSIWHLVQNLN